MKVVEPIRDLDILEYMCRTLRNGNIKFKTGTKKNQGERNYIMFFLGIYSGLRISDILNLKVKHVRNKKHISLQEKKTGKTKKFPINQILKKEIDEYIDGKDDEDYLFKGQKNKVKPITTTQAYRIIKKAADDLDLQSIATHSMRKTFGYHYYQRTKDIATLQKIFNHGSPTTTLIYIGIIQDNIDEAYHNFKLF